MLKNLCFLFSYQLPELQGILGISRYSLKSSGLHIVHWGTLNSRPALLNLVISSCRDQWKLEFPISQKSILIQTVSKCQPIDQGLPSLPLWTLCCPHSTIYYHYGNVFARAPTSSIVIHTSLNILSESVSQNNRTHYFYLGTWHRRETVYPASLAAMHGQITKFWTRECERKWHIQPGCVLKWWAPSFLWVLTWIMDSGSHLGSFINRHPKDRKEQNRRS